MIQLEDPATREQEQQRDTAARRMASEDPATYTREQEQQCDTTACRMAREDPATREEEQQRDTAACRLVREDSGERSNNEIQLPINTLGLIHSTELRSSRLTPHTDNR